MLGKVLMSSSYKVKNKTALDYDTALDDAHENECYNIKRDRTNNRTFYGIEGEEMIARDALL